MDNRLRLTRLAALCRGWIALLQDRPRPYTAWDADLLSTLTDTVWDLDGLVDVCYFAHLVELDIAPHYITGKCNRIAEQEASGG